MEAVMLLDPETTLVIGWITGGVVGYVAGFFMASLIYRSWRRT